MVSARVVSIVLLLACGCASVDPARDGSVPDLGAPLADQAMAGAHDAAQPAPVVDMAMVAPVDMAMVAPVDMATQDLGPFPPGAVYNVSNKATGKLLSIHNSSTLANSITEERGADNGLDQRWRLVAAGAGYQLVNDQSHTCLDVQNGITSDGATTWIEPCTAATSQQWILMDAGAGFYNLVDANSMSCLDLDHGNSADGTVIFQYHCNGGDNQKWIFVRLQG
jgi:hypothetical protein